MNEKHDGVLAMFVKPYLMTHDLSCVLGALAGAACSYPRGVPRALATRPGRDLVVAAVAFTIQLAIDEADRDPAEMRALERDLIAVLTEIR